MTNRIDGIDESFSVADAAALAKAGVRVAMRYLSHTPAKNWTAAQIKAHHRAGIGVIFGWETTANRALNGGAAGKADGREAAGQANALFGAVGYRPAGKVAVYLAVDFDASSGQHPAIGAYLAAARDELHAAGFLCGVYANADVVDWSHKAGLTDVEWQTYAWSGGRLSPEADFYQWLNGQHLGGAEVDFDQIIHESTLGAWWPPGSPNNTEEDDMAMTPKERTALINDITNAVWSHMAKGLDDGAPARRMDVATVTSMSRLYTVEAVQRSIVAKIDAVSKVLSAANGVLPRVAAIQAAVGKLPKTVPAPVDVAKLAVDVASKVAVGPVDAVKIADAVAARVKALAWKAA